VIGPMTVTRLGKARVNLFTRAWHSAKVINYLRTVLNTLKIEKEWKGRGKLTSPEIALEMNERKGMATAQLLPDIPCFCVFSFSLFGVSVRLCFSFFLFLPPWVLSVYSLFSVSPPLCSFLLSFSVPSCLFSCSIFFFSVSVHSSSVSLYFSLAVPCSRCSGC
jgi:hypothetical protein